MNDREKGLARRILEAGRGIPKDELLDGIPDERDWARELREAGLDKVWDLERALVPVVAAMRERGFGIDVKKLESLARSAEQNRRETEKKVKEELGADLNPRSPKQVKEALEKRGLKLKSTD
jgi:DNA polymerase I-like protein with 3'-5' exonuclease and polymerase domains